MRKAIYAGAVIGFACLVLISCATTAYKTYSEDIFVGKRLFEKKEYGEAKIRFQEAATVLRDSVSLTYLAVIEYKLGNMESAEKWMREAEKERPDTLCYYRTFGYRALIYLKRDRNAGMAALKDYIDRYQTAFPLESIKDVKNMWESGKIDEARLEKLIEEQITWYEREMEQFQTSHTGFFARDARSIESGR